MPENLHKRLVARLVAKQGAHTDGFRKRAAEFLRTVPGWTSDYEEDVEIPRYVPDAYRLDLPEGSRAARITIWEVEVTNPVTQAKLDAYTAFWADLDASDLHAVLDLRAVDKYGFERPTPLLAHYFAAISDDCESVVADVAADLQLAPVA